jgi:hypothetical protein
MPRKKREGPPRPPRAPKIPKKAGDPWDGEWNGYVRKNGKPHKPPPEPDGKIHVPNILSPDPMIFPPKLRLALQFYLDVLPRDAEKAAQRVGMDPEEFKMHLHSPGVHEWLVKQEQMIEEKCAEYRAMARILSVDFLDTSLVECVTVAAKRGESKPLELGYERIGMRRDDNFMSQQQASPQTRPQVYRVLEHTVTHTEQVTQREISAGDTQPVQRPRQLQRAHRDEVLEY